MRLLVGITTSDLAQLQHSAAVISCPGATVIAYSDSRLLAGRPANGQRLDLVRGAARIGLSSAHGLIHIEGVEQAAPVLAIIPPGEATVLSVPSIHRPGPRGNSAPNYKGVLYALADGGQLRLILETELDEYLQGVLQSEIPASYAIEAIKAQAVTARTYALRPRIDHTLDNCNVCDSFLCCQYFGGVTQVDQRHKEGIESTRGEVLTYGNQPILALFSSCAGGHTENYENCFSDPQTGAFPPAALPYLRGVPEGELPSGYGVMNMPEQAMRKLWSMEAPQTNDAYSSQFRWSLQLTADALESHVHHTLGELSADKTASSFIKPPKSGKFGHIKSFAVTRRGVAGTAIELAIETAAGTWTVSKELLIRSTFKLSSLKIARLKSARIFFQHHYDHLGLLTSINVQGFGFGHGVGLQQTGAQGMAKKGRTFQQILSHYFVGTNLERV